MRQPKFIHSPNLIGGSKGCLRKPPVSCPPKAFYVSCFMINTIYLIRLVNYLVQLSNLTGDGANGPLKTLYGPSAAPTRMARSQRNNVSAKPHNTTKPTITNQTGEEGSSLSTTYDHAHDPKKSIAIDRKIASSAEVLLAVGISLFSLLREIPLKQIIGSLRQRRP